MKKYLFLQFKRVLRILPYVFCVVLVLFGALMIFYSSMLIMNEESADNQAFKVALSGSTDEPMLKMGLSALQAFDSTRFSIEVVQMEESDAVSALERGDIAAYVVVPEGFVEAALHGDIMPLKYVSTNGAVGLVSIFKDEITGLISDILVAAQKGTYGISAALKDNGLPGAGAMMNDLSIEYVEFVLVRSNAYSTEELGIADGLGLEGYLFCGVTVLFLLLICLPFAPLFVRRDHSLSRMLTAKRRSLFGQTVCEFAAYLAGMLLLLLAVIPILFLLGHFFPNQLFENVDPIRMIITVLQMIPALVMITSLSFMLYELTNDLISGVLLQFFVTFALAFASGCLYPVFFFPESVQKLAAHLPTGIARSHLAACLTDSPSALTLAALVAYSLLFLVIAYLVRRHKTLRHRG